MITLQLTREQAEAIEVRADEPYAVPCSSPPQCAEDQLIQETHKWNLWDYVCKGRKTGNLIRVSGYTKAMLRGWWYKFPGSHPPPEEEIQLGTMVYVISRPK